MLRAPALAWQGVLAADPAGSTAHLNLPPVEREVSRAVLGAGLRLDVVSRQLGHASIATTGNIYTHDSDEAAAEASERLAALMEGPSAPRIAGEGTWNKPLKIPLPVDDALRAAMQVPPEKLRKERKRPKKRGR
jgi:hypothetical protein